MMRCFCFLNNSEAKRVFASSTELTEVKYFAFALIPKVLNGKRSTFSTIFMCIRVSEDEGIDSRARQQTHFHIFCSKKKKAIRKVSVWLRGYVLTEGKRG
jgi:hypothetical protein